MALAGAVMLAWTGLAGAQEAPLDLSTPAQAYAQRAMPMMLAANDSVVATDKSPSVTAPSAQPEFEESWLTGGKAHMVLGLATIATALATGATAPGEGCETNCPAVLPPRETNGTHAKLAKLTTALAVATVATGLYYHWDDFHLEDGLTDPDNLHVILGVTGAALMAYATAKSAGSTTPVSHAGMGMAGAYGMIAAVKIAW
ncbi:MAG: hypothetical protein KKF58_02120 [Gammaproteobacteria bacterium]|nr:hypothetical protein [Gammaproteobacteria bacterium]MBU1447084.1 hypothetical protein [Gammaproteobacteria bacterium]